MTFQRFHYLDVNIIYVNVKILNVTSRNWWQVFNLSALELFVEDLLLSDDNILKHVTSLSFTKNDMYF